MRRSIRRITARKTKKKMLNQGMMVTSGPATGLIEIALGKEET